MPPTGASTAQRAIDDDTVAPRTRSTAANTAGTAAKAHTASDASHGTEAGECSAIHSASVPRPRTAATPVIHAEARRARAAHAAPAASATSMSASGTTCGPISAHVAK